MIGRAYEQYYTHSDYRPKRLRRWLGERVLHTVWSARLGVDLEPRLRLPRSLVKALTPSRGMFEAPFELEVLARLRRGTVVDLGCGSGRMVGYAAQLGWKARGIEIDPAAVRHARDQGLDVLEGSHDRLASDRIKYDCIICSHVLEHVHDPIELLRSVRDALSLGGTLLLSAPNAQSVLRSHFGSSWRGLEAPRHLAIPSGTRLVSLLHGLGFSVTALHAPGLYTAAESSRLERRDTEVTRHDRRVASKLARSLNPDVSSQDFHRLVCVKGVG